MKPIVKVTIEHSDGETVAMDIAKNQSVIIAVQKPDGIEITSKASMKFSELAIEALGKLISETKARREKMDNFVTEILKDILGCATCDKKAECDEMKVKCH